MAFTFQNIISNIIVDKKQNLVTFTVTTQMKSDVEINTEGYAVYGSRPRIDIYDGRSDLQTKLTYNEFDPFEKNFEANVWQTIRTFDLNLTSLNNGDLPSINTVFSGGIQSGDTQTTFVFNEGLYTEINVGLEPTVVSLKQVGQTLTTVDISYKLDVSKIKKLYVVKNSDLATVEELFKNDDYYMFEDDESAATGTFIIDETDSEFEAVNEYDEDAMQAYTLVETSTLGEGTVQIGNSHFANISDRYVNFIFVYDCGYAPIGEQYIVSNKILANFNDKCTIINTNFTFDIGGSLDLTFRNSDYNPITMTLQAKHPAQTQWTDIETKTLQQSEYTWDLSSFATEMYSMVPDSNVLDIRIINTTEDIVVGKAYVANSNPVASVIKYVNMDTVRGLLETTETAVTLVNTMYPITVKSAIASAKNAATIVNYSLIIDSQTYSSDSDFSKGQSYIALFPGVHTVSLTVTDSRGNKDTVTSTFEAISYHIPLIVSGSISRRGAVGADLIGDLAFNISNVKYNNQIKNIIESINVQIDCITTNTTGSPFSILPATTSVDSDTETKVSIVRTGDNNPIATVTQIYDYVVTLTITDTLGNYATKTYTIPSAKTLLGIFDNGKVIINQIPTDDILGDGNANLIVGGDAKINGIYIADRVIKMMTQCSNMEPSDSSQVVGSLWLEEDIE